MLKSSLNDKLYYSSLCLSSLPKLPKTYKYTIHLVQCICPYDSLITHKYTAVLPSVSEPAVSFEGFVICFPQGHKKYVICSHICVDRRRGEALTTTWKKNCHILAVSTDGFLSQLKRLTCDPEQIVHDIFFSVAQGLKQTIFQSWQAWHYEKR